MIISTVSLKGGSGKTTTAINLAVYYSSLNYSVTIVDADENENSIKWSGVRDCSVNPVTVVGLKNPAALRNNINELHSKTDIVIIDGTPAINEISATIMLLSDLTIFPLQASPLDVWAFDEKFMPKFEEIKTIQPDLKGIILLNNIDPRTKFSREIKEFVNDYKLPVLKTVISDLQVYKDCIAYGMGAIEANNQKAKTEIFNLGNELNNYVEL